MAKRIQISSDDTTYYTFPGSKGEMTREGASIKDTIFGTNFGSDQTGLISWGLNSNGIYKGYAGYVAKILKSGTSTAFADEACTNLSGKIYRITDLTKSVWDRSVAVTVDDDGSAVAAANIESIDYLFGKVTLASGYTPTGDITVSGNYLPMTQLGKGNSFTLTQTANAVDNSDFETVQGNSGFRTYEYGLRTVALAMKGIYASANAFETLLTGRAECILELNPDGAGLSTARGWFKPLTMGQNGDVGELEEQDINFVLSVPDQEDITVPFGWLHSSSAVLNTALQKALTAWDAGTLSYFKYLADGTNGFKGQGVITDISLTGGLEAMNDFNIKVQGCGGLTAVP